MSNLQLRGISHRYVMDEVLKNIDLTLEEGGWTALVGPSGCGKTTLLNLAAGLLEPTEGEVHNTFASTAYVFQQPRLLPWQRAAENIALGLKARGVPHAVRRERAYQLGQALGFDKGDLHKYPHELSGGMQSRVALARAFAVEPELLLLDEPFSALDIGLKAELYRLLLAQVAERGTAVMMITHDLMEAVRLADRIVVMAPEPGQIVWHQQLERPAATRDDDYVYHTTAQLMQTATVRASFGLEGSE